MCTKGFSKKVIQLILISLPLFYSRQKKSHPRMFEMFLFPFSKDGGKYTQSITIYDSHQNDSFPHICFTPNLHKMQQSIRTRFPEIALKILAIVSAYTNFSAWQTVLIADAVSF